MSLQKTCRYLCLIWVMVPLQLFAQIDTCQFVVSGQVLDEHDNTPLPFAEIFVKGTMKGTVADAQGNYVIRNICAGEITIVVYHIGCEAIFNTINIKSNIRGLNFYPEHHQELLEEAQIVSEKRRESAEAISVLSTKQLEEVRGKDLAKGLELVSGVRTLKTGGAISKPIIHGLYGPRILMINNGVRQEDQQWGLEHAPNIDPFSADNITVVKGASAVRYGVGAIGGVVKVDAGALPFFKEFNGRAHLIGQSNGRGGATALKLVHGLDSNWAYSVQLSGRKLGDLSAPNYLLTNTGMEQWNASAQLGFQKNHLKLEAYYSHFSSVIAILRSSHIGNLTDLRNAVESSRPLVIEPFSYTIDNPYQNINHDLAKISGLYTIGPKSKLRFLYGFQLNERQEFDLRRAGREDIPANSLRLYTHSADLIFENESGGKFFGTLGVNGWVQRNSNESGTGVRPILPNYNKELLGVYVMEKVKLLRWIIEGGLRYDFQHILAQKFDRNQDLQQYALDYNAYSASLGATYFLNSHFQLSSLVAYANRAPEVNELLSEGLHHGASTIEIGDLNLVPEKALNWSMTASVAYASKFRMELTAYLNPINDYIYLRPEQEPQLTVRGAFPVSRYTQTNALLTGLDLDIELFVHENWQYIIRGNLVRGYDQSVNDYLTLMPADQILHSLKWSPNSWRFLKKPSIGISHRLVDEQRFYPNDSELLDIHPPDGYQLFDFTLGSGVGLFGQEFIITITFENITDKAYRDYLNRQRFYADEPGRNIILKINYQF